MSTISNDVLEKLSVRYRLLAKIHDGSESQAWEESALIVEELLALRKEREKAEPVAWRHDGGPFASGALTRSKSVAERWIANGWKVTALYTEPPAPVDDDSLPYDPQIAEYEQMMEAEQAQADTTSQQFESLAFKSVVPEGWKLVPVELTKEMRGKIHPFAEATCLNCGRQVVADCEDNVTASWNDMLAVAPEPCK
ncbi:hypothetical protein ACVF5T_001734 [Cronobacter sakazakii]